MDFSQSTSSSKSFLTIPIPNTMFALISYSYRLEKTTIERHSENLYKTYKF